MNIHSMLVFLHVLSAMGIFMALAVEVVALGRLRRANTPADAGTWMSVLRGVSRLAPISMLTLLVTGIWMMVQWWHHQPWIEASFVGVVVMAVLGGVATGRSMRRLGKALPAESGPELSAAFRSRRSSPALAASLRLRLAIAIGIVALMTIKPGLAMSLLILVAAIVAGLLASLRVGARRATESTEAGRQPVRHEFEF